MFNKTSQVFCGGNGLKWFGEIEFIFRQVVGGFSIAELELEKEER